MEDSEKLDLIYHALRDYSNLGSQDWYKDGDLYFKRRYEKSRELLFFAVEDSNLIIGKKEIFEYGQASDLVHISDKVISTPVFLSEHTLRSIVRLTQLLITDYYPEFLGL